MSIHNGSGFLMAYKRKRYIFHQLGPVRLLIPTSSVKKSLGWALDNVVVENDALNSLDSYKDGSEISFDAVRINNNYEIIIMWVGEKPHTIKLPNKDSYLLLKIYYRVETDFSISGGYHCVVTIGGKKRQLEVPSHIYEAGTEREFHNPSDFKNIRAIVHGILEWNEAGELVVSYKIFTLYSLGSLPSYMEKINEQTFYKNDMKILQNSYNSYDLYLDIDGTFLTNNAFQSEISGKRVKVETIVNKIKSANVTPRNNVLHILYKCNVNSCNGIVINKNGRNCAMRNIVTNSEHDDQIKVNPNTNDVEGRNCGSKIDGSDYRNESVENNCDKLFVSNYKEKTDEVNNESSIYEINHQDNVPLKKIVIDKSRIENSQEIISLNIEMNIQNNSENRINKNNTSEINLYGSLEKDTENSTMICSSEGFTGNNPVCGLHIMTNCNSCSPTPICGKKIYTEEKGQEESSKEKEQKGIIKEIKQDESIKEEEQEESTKEKGITKEINQEESGQKEIAMKGVLEETASKMKKNKTVWKMEKEETAWKMELEEFFRNLLNKKTVRNIGSEETVRNMKKEEITRKKENEEIAKKRENEEIARKKENEEIARKKENEEIARKKENAEIARKKENAEIARKKENAEIARKKENAEIARKKENAEIARKKENAEIARKKENAEINAEIARKKENEEIARKKENAEIARKKENAEIARKKENAEIARKKENEEIARKKENEEIARKKLNEEIARQEKEETVWKKENEEMARQEKEETVWKIKKKETSWKMELEEFFGKMMNDEITRKKENEEIARKKENEEIERKKEKEEIVRKKEKEKIARKVEKLVAARKLEKLETTRKLEKLETTRKLEKEETTRKLEKLETTRKLEKEETASKEKEETASKEKEETARKLEKEEIARKMEKEETARKGEKEETARKLEKEETARKLEKEENAKKEQTAMNKRKQETVSTDINNLPSNSRKNIDIKFTKSRSVSFFMNEILRCNSSSSCTNALEIKNYKCKCIERTEQFHILKAGKNYIFLASDAYVGKNSSDKMKNNFHPKISCFEIPPHSMSGDLIIVDLFAFVGYNDPDIPEIKQRKEILGSISSVQDIVNCAHRNILHLVKNSYVVDMKKDNKISIIKATKKSIDPTLKKVCLTSSSKTCRSSSSTIRKASNRKDSKHSSVSEPRENVGKIHSLDSSSGKLITYCGRILDFTSSVCFVDTIPLQSFDLTLMLSKGTSLRYQEVSGTVDRVDFSDKEYSENTTKLPTEVMQKWCADNGISHKLTRKLMKKATEMMPKRIRYSHSKKYFS